MPIPYILLIVAALVGSLFLLSQVLLPFVAGMIIAYFLDPVADRLEAMGISRTIATLLILLGFFALFGVVIALIFPLLQDQILGFIRQLPGYIEQLTLFLAPYLDSFNEQFGPEQMAKLKNMAADSSGKVASVMADVLGKVWSGGMALVSLLSLLFVTPVVAFYLLRDWDRIVERVDELLPRQSAPVVREQMSEIDKTLAGFIRGQASVCLALATIYGVGLTLAGLDFGLTIGLIAGLVSFIPYFGTGVGLVASVGMALAQFDDPMRIGIVVAIFMFGQVLDSLLFQPKWVGDSVNLHPVWVIFALFAGGALFGFTGMLLAIPVAAVVGVLVRYSRKRYMASRVYSGDSTAS